MHAYQVVILGEVPNFAADIRERLKQAASELGLLPSHLRILEEHEVSSRDRKSPVVATFFGYSGASDVAHPAVAELHADSVPIVPAVESLEAFRSLVPLTLAGVNGLSVADRDGVTRLVSSLLENLHLLRRERRLFISYRRAESTPVAMQLYEALDGYGFDVFLDTRSVRAGVDFSVGALAQVS